MKEHDATFTCMGSRMRLLIGPPVEAGASSVADAAESARAFLGNFDTRLSRFRPDSELSALNADPRSAVPASRLLCQAVAAAVWAAQRTDGLVDPTLVRALEHAGYRGSRAGLPAPPLAAALASAPPRRSAQPHPDAAWRAIGVDHRAGLVHRPPGLMLDTGGTGKGLAADTVARRLQGHSRFAVDCGGDLRIGGVHAAGQPYEIEIEHPLTLERTHRLRVGAGGVATSALNSRLWQCDKGYVHHLLDPSTGEPAWTGLIAATVLAPTALEAEVLAKAALLSGPSAARGLLAEHGGILVHDDGDVETVGPLRARVRFAVRLPGRPAITGEVAA